MFSNRLFMIVELEDPTEAFVLSKQVLEAFVFPTLSEEGQKTLTENLAGSVEAAFANPDVSTYGVRANQALVGYAAVGKNFHISQLVVAASSQRQGLGRQIIDFIEQRAIAAGVAQLTVKASLNAVQFYQKCGFEVTAEVQDKAGVRFQPMQKKLSQ